MRKSAEHASLRAEDPLGLAVQGGGAGGLRRGANEIDAGAEMLAFPAENDDTAPGAAVDRLVRLRQRADEVEVEEVVRRTAQLDRRDEIVARGDADVAEPLARHGSTIFDIDVEIQPGRSFSGLPPGAAARAAATRRPGPRCR